MAKAAMDTMAEMGTTVEMEAGAGVAMAREVGILGGRVGTMTFGLGNRVRARWLYFTRQHVGFHCQTACTMC